MIKAFVCSPYRATKFSTVEQNIELAGKICCYCIKNNWKPFAPHLFYPIFLDDSEEEQREIGIKLSLEHIQESDILVLPDWIEPTEGMKREISAWGSKTIYRVLKDSLEGLG